ncbi:fibronectin type III domain-containing protein 1-like [Diachasmimorpha longicaudata]|uniref:fibronectin type III domain-containing protein 1-like n=1 Tax=Diachasmimorpha longicaudata TaxID=58733 RepID=UPI0030B8A9C6
MMRKFIIFAVVVVVIEATSVCDHEKTCCCDKDKCDVIIVPRCACDRFCNSSTKATSDSVNPPRREPIADEDDSRLPRNLRVEAAGFGDLLVKWDPPAGSSANRDIRGYSIAWGLSGDGNLRALENIGRTTQYILRELLADSDYIVYVSTVYAKGFGPSVSAIGRTLPEGSVPQPPNAVTDLQATALRPRLVFLNWTMSSSPENPITKAIIEYRVLESNTTQKWEYFSTTDHVLMHGAQGHIHKANTHIKDLEPNTEYMFRVITSSPGGQSVPSNSVVVRTPPEPALLPPRNLDGSWSQSGAFEFTWTDPGDVEPIGYTITVEGVRDDNTLVCRQTFLTDGTSYSLTNLQHDVHYTISVRARNKAGLGPPSYLYPIPVDFEENPANDDFPQRPNQDSGSVSIPEGAVHIRYPDSIKAGDLVSLSCTVDYQNRPRENKGKFRWLMSDDSGNIHDVPPSDKFDVKFFTDDTSYGMVLRIHNFDSRDQRLYICQLHADGQDYTREVTLNGMVNEFVDQPVPPQEPPVYPMPVPPQFPAGVMPQSEGNSFQPSAPFPSAIKPGTRHPPPGSVNNPQALCT